MTQDDTNRCGVEIDSTPEPLAIAENKFNKEMDRQLAAERAKKAAAPKPPKFAPPLKPQGSDCGV